MLSWVIQISIISIILIFLVHYLFNFFKETLTVPKIKDLVNVPNKKYENMYNIISKNNGISEPANYTDIDLLPTQPDNKIEENDYQKWDKSSDADSMNSELKSFLKKQLKESSSDISTLNSTPNSSSYSYADY
jgi:hypothetical protein